ncbi:MAG: peptidylprolyl isomerase [Rhizobiales bacterium]|nr:peptidylprolyl isomerase [Hyphomicrobiales bacterium]MBI3673362.1 peptidylprolyl isomerase [Hyphomicrobiales bacterium]
MLFRLFRLFGALVGVVIPLALNAPHASAEGASVVAIANDQPITELDITQRMALLRILESLPQGELTRKRTLRILVDDVVKMVEANRLKMTPTDTEVTQRISLLATGMKTTPADLLSRLAKQGIGEAAFRRYLSTQMGFDRIIVSKYQADVTVQPAEVDRKTAEIQQNVDSRMGQIMKDPRMQSVVVYTLMEITLPVEGGDAMTAELLQARAMEAAQVARQFNGCANARAAAEGVFNVKFGKKIDADAAKLPPPMKSALDKAGVGKAIGPMRSKDGIQLVAYCGSRKVVPPQPKFEMPTRQQIQNLLINQKYETLQEQYLQTARKSVYVEYRDPSLSQ